MTQRWRSLWFLHASYDPQLIQSLLPKGLTADTFPDENGIEQAWVGLVLFRMEGVTLKSFPEVPGIHAFPESNVRTYVHREGKEPGVWFFSLDAANVLACNIARRFFHLPYHAAMMKVDDQTTTINYTSSRVGNNDARVDASCQLGQLLPSPEPGTLEFFLAERYLLYAGNQGRLHPFNV